MNPVRREKIRVNGIVQGVGFRPFVYRLAQECKLGGFVRNNGRGVLIEVEGACDSLEQFRQRLHQEIPPLAQIVEWDIEFIPFLGERTFTIQISERDVSPNTLIPPDITVCDDCLRELFEPSDRRYRYPFINCTNCGPRYTIVHSIPYDRPFTSMASFVMCEACEREYHDPADRRFHAQPNACPICGPRLRLHDHKGREVATDDAINDVTKLLRQGKILAIKGLGGFHLAVDACNETAVRELRRRKGRAEKPFALMAPDVTSVRNFCLVSNSENALLQSPARPIVLLRAHAQQAIAPFVAPGHRNLGFMLPYTPLHYLLLKDNLEALVMTSGNFSEEPIAIGNEEALERLATLADFVLLHDRDILQRCDDAIVRVSAGQSRLLRRSRGYVPRPVFLKTPTQKRILATGGELKNTIALSRDKAVFLSQHIGDLDNPAALAFFEESITHLQNILEITPEAIAYDLHPEYLSTKWAMEQDGLLRVGVQHHHAHLASVMAENQVEDRTIGIILDGTGYGADGTIWGGEVLLGDTQDFERFAWLTPVALPGGAAAIRQPWRMALSYLYEVFGDEVFNLRLPFLQRRTEQEISLLQQMISNGINSPLTSSCGRLFDAVAAMLDIREEVNYEAQAAIELETCIDEHETEPYQQAIPGSDVCGAIDLTGLIRSIMEDICAGTMVGRIAARFHRTLAEMFLTAAVAARKRAGIARVALSGGVFQNAHFLTYLCDRLQQHGFTVLTHKQVPSNDGGLALGQIVIAAEKLKSLNC